MKSLKMIFLLSLFSYMGCGSPGSETPQTKDSTKESSLASMAITPQTDVDCALGDVLVPHGTSVTAYQNSTVPYGESCVSEQRQCYVGVLSGSYNYTSCTVGAAAACLFNGATINSGDSVTAYTSSTVAAGLSCDSVAETRTCTNGVLSGGALYSSCTVNAAKSCLFNGITVDNNTSVIAYQSTTAEYGKTCQQESRVCKDGVLSGSYEFGSCTVNQPAGCLFDGVTMASGEAVTTFQASHVPSGQTCASEQRVCSNGVLSGSYTNKTCVVDAPIVVIDPVEPKNCTFNNSTVLHQSVIVAYETSHVPYGSVCKSEERLCDDGFLTGSFSNSSCVVDPLIPPPPPDPTCKNSNIIWEFPEDCKGNCGKGVGYFKSRISRDGGKTWLTMMKNRLPQELEEIWNYLIKQNGKNSCNRPLLKYEASKNKGYVVLPQIKIPDCKVCRFEEVEKEESHHGQCHKVSHKKEKVLKFKCGKSS